MNCLATALDDEGRYAEAEKLYRETLDIQRRVLGTEHPDTLRSMNNLAIVLNHQRRFTEAEKLHRETLDIQRRILGPGAFFLMLDSCAGREKCRPITCSRGTGKRSTTGLN